MRYKVIKTEVINPDIDSKEWDKAEEGSIAVERWSGFYPVPKTTFKVLRGPEGISVLMHTEEENLRAEQTEENSMVYEDSCLEFFFKPDPWDVNYLNFEINPRGVMHLGLGKDRHKRQLIDVDRKIFSIVSIPNDGDWKLKFYIPDEFLLKYFNKIAPVCRANFYKCGELTGHSHFGSWSEVEVDSPDFHIPDFFGKIEFQNT